MATTHVRIFKYPVPLEDSFTLSLPLGASILDVQVQGRDMVMWAMVNPEGESEARSFRWIATGGEISSDEWPDLRHIATVQIEQVLVFHLFEVRA